MGLTKEEAIDLARKEAETRGYSTAALPTVYGALQEDGIWRIVFEEAPPDVATTGGGGFAVRIDNKSRKFLSLKKSQ